MRDMKAFSFFERLFVDTVPGVQRSMVNINSIHATRRLQFLSRESHLLQLDEMSTVSSSSLTPNRDRREDLEGSRPQRPPRKLQAKRLDGRSVDKRILKGRARWLQEERNAVTRTPTAIEAAGVKPDGKAGGPRMTRLNVSWQIMTGDDGVLAHRVLSELNSVDMHAVTLQLETVMRAVFPLLLPRWYNVVIVGIEAHPATEVPYADDTNETSATKSKMSVAASLFRPSCLLWNLAVAFAATVIHASRWL